MFIQFRVSLLRMIHQRYIDRSIYFNEMLQTTEKYVVPWIKEMISLQGKRVLEIGCGEGGNLVPFEDEGCSVMGIDRNPKRIEMAKNFIADRNSGSTVELATAEALELSAERYGKFDLIILKDFIEHIDRERFLPILKELLAPNGMAFIGFPPWLMPYGGHQQVCHSRFAKLPWLHLFPKTIYLKWLATVGESENVITSLAENYDDGLTIETLHSQLKNSGFGVVKEQHFLINPGYEAKFGLKPRKQLPVLDSVPWFRNFYTTCSYLLVSVAD